MAEQDKSFSSITLSKAYEDPEAELRKHLPPWKESSTSQKLHILLLYSVISLPVSVLLFVEIGGYLFYVALLIAPLIGDESDPPELYYWHTDTEHDNAKTRGITYLVIQSVCIVLVLCSHLKAMMTDPGLIPDTPAWKDNGDSGSEIGEDITKNLIEKGKTGEIRACNRCNKKKPDRTHHCRQCDRCNLKMDHHCNWIANCVGYHNYKFFFLMVFYGSIALGLFIATFWECVVVVLNDSTSSTSLCFFVVLVYSLIIMLGIAVIGFCSFHIWLISNNYTTIEYCEKKRKDVPGYEKSPFAFASTYKNFQEALGPNPLYWWLPTSYRDNSGGLYFK